MNMKYLWAVVLLAMSLGMAEAKASDMDIYVSKLAEHPQVTQILEQSSRFKELSDGELGLPDLQITIGVDNVPANDPSFNQFSPTSKVLEFEQRIPSYRLRKAKSARHDVLSKRQMLMADYTLKRLEAILITQLTELNKVKTLEELANQQFKLYRSMDADLRGQLEAGNPVYGRLSEIDVERTELEQRLNDLKIEKITIEEELIRLVGEVPNIALLSATDVSWHRDSDALYPVRIAYEDVRVAAKDIDTADAAFGPNYGVQATYKQREDSRNFAGDDWFSIQATISIPLWYESNQKPKLRAAQAGKRSAEFAYEDTKRDWVKRMAVLKAEHDITLENITLLQEEKAALKEMVGAASRNYESGNAPLETVLDAQIDVLTIASQLATQRSRHIRLSAQFNSHIIGGQNEDN